MKLKHLLTVLLVLVLCFSLVFVAVACGDDTTDNTDTDTSTDTTDTDTEESETLLIANGRFESFSEGSAPNKPTSWSSPSVSDSTADYKAGVIPMKQADYTAAMSNWGNLAEPAAVPGAAEDNHVLLIYNSAANVVSYKPESTFTTTIGAYYKFSVQLLVKRGEVGLTEGSGAYVSFTGAANHKFGPFTETDEWQTVTFYVAASQVSAQNITITLSMGTTGNATTGYVFFDNMVAEKITAEAYNTAVLTDTVHTAAYSMLVPDGDFINVTTSDAYNNPAVWSGNKGTGNGDDCNTNYLRMGIIDTSDAGWASWADAASLTDTANVGTPTDLDGNPLSADGKVLAISNQYALASGGASLVNECFTAYGYTNTLKMHIAPGAAYKLSVWVYTDLNTTATVQTAKATADDIDTDLSEYAYGANILFSGYGDYSFKNINTGKTWKEYTFYVIGSETRYKDVNIELWLGEGGMSDKTRASGSVYFDSITLTKLDYASRAAAVADCQAKVPTSDGKAVVVDMQDADNMAIANGNGNFDNGTDGWVIEAVNDVKDTANDVITAVLDTTAYNEAEWKTQYKLDANPLAPHEFNPVLMINNVNPSAYFVRTEGSMTVKANMFYRVAVWVKTADIEDSKGITVALMNADDDTAITSFTTVNTAKYENEIDGVNGYEELEFYIKGSGNVTETGANADDKEVYIKITFGTGNNFDTDEFLAGKVFIANVNMQKIDSSEYSSHSSSTTYSKAYSFAATSGSTSGSFADGKFNVIEFKDENVDDEGKQIGLYKPSSWTIPSVTNVNAGVLNITQQDYVDELRGLTQTDFVTVYNEWGDVSDSVKEDYMLDFGAPNVFVAYTTKDATAKAAKILYNTSSVSLSANSYYIIRCYVRAVGTVAQLELSTTGNKQTTVVDIDATDKWEEVKFAVKTSTFGSVNATVNLYLGKYSEEKDKEDAAKTAYQGIIFADSFTCYSISAAQYEAFLADSEDINYTTETFDTTSTTTGLSTPGSTLWSADGSSDNTKAVGIYHRNYTTTELKYMTKDEEDKDVAVDEKTLTEANVFDATGLEDGVTLGDGVLVINHQTAGYYKYKSSSITLKAGSAYKLTLDARTFNIAEGQFARIRIATSTDNYDLVFNAEHVYKVDANGNYVKAEGNYTYDTKDSKWTRYSFYILNSKSSSVSATVNLMLGMSATDAGADEAVRVQGTALFDNVTFEEITSDAFYTEYAKVYVLDADKAVTKDEAGNDVRATGADQYQLTANAVRLADDISTDPEKEDDKDKEEEKPETDSSLIWLYVTSIVIAGMLIIVIVIWLIRRYAPKNLFKRAKKLDYDRNNAEDDTDGKAKKEAVEDKKSNDEFQD